MSATWDAIVGIDLDDWMRASNPTQVAWLIWLRDHPTPPQGPRPAPERCDDCDYIDVPSFGTSFTAVIPGRRCGRHAA